MKGQKMLSICSLLMVVICLLGFATGALGFLSIRELKVTKDAESVDAQAKIATLVDAKASLEAQKADYETGKEALEAKKKQYESGKESYDASKSAYDANVADFEKAKSDGKMTDAQKEATQTSLDEVAAELDKAQEVLAEYESLQTSITEYESAKDSVDTGIANLSQKETVRAKIDTGMDAITAAQAVVTDEARKTDAEIMVRLFTDAAVIIVALFTVICAILGFGASKNPTESKTKGCLIFGLVNFVIAVVANGYGGMFGYINYLAIMAVLVIEAIFAILYVVATLKLKKSLGSGESFIAE